MYYWCSIHNKMKSYNKLKEAYKLPYFIYGNIYNVKFIHMFIRMLRIKTCQKQ